MSDQTSVLLVEDDRNIVDLVQSNLLIRGYRVYVSRDGRDVMELVDDMQPDLALVDLMLPAADGFEVCRKIREKGSMGIIVLSARGAETDKVRALNLGADDYLTKPFGVDELLARINATLRRSRPPESAPDASEPPLQIGSVRIDFDAKSVTRAGERVKLTPTEYALLAELARGRGKVLSHSVLLHKVWGVGYATNTEYVRVYVGRLRAKLEEPGDPPLIVTEPRTGYRMLAD
ncbi:response regulator transcription factor [Galbitalea soli]|uniref:Response regulator transcription factor n=1 Tax=Galbitalea soli TaxID=1268042 RepID=A0A7C9TT48_9MICO|nr:response regulator transcription factor [Galbitalea soli]NEM92555.1 response regulator transcription factor [Galbitalea soli]NYJ29592.1 two-component system KDP operon response regulator KdpE [Galbitalea soli]